MISNTMFDTTITASTVNVDMKLKELEYRITNLEDSTINSNSSFKFNSKKQNKYIVCRVVGNIGQTYTKLKFLDLNKKSDLKFYGEMKHFIVIVNAFDNLYTAYDFYLKLIKKK